MEILLETVESLLEASGSGRSRSKLILSTHKPSLATQQTIKTSRLSVKRSPDKRHGNALLISEAAPCVLALQSVQRLCSPGTRAGLGSGEAGVLGSACAVCAYTRVPASLHSSLSPRRRLARENARMLWHSTMQLPTKDCCIINDFWRLCHKTLHRFGAFFLKMNGSTVKI